MAKATIDCDDIVGVALMDAVQTVSRSAEREGVFVLFPKDDHVRHSDPVRDAMAAVCFAVLLGICVAFRRPANLGPLKVKP